MDHPSHLNVPSSILIGFLRESVGDARDLITRHFREKEAFPTSSLFGSFSARRSQLSVSSFSIVGDKEVQAQTSLDSNDGISSKRSLRFVEYIRDPVLEGTLRLEDGSDGLLILQTCLALRIARRKILGTGRARGYGVHFSDFEIPSEEGEHRSAEVIRQALAFDYGKWLASLSERLMALKLETERPETDFDVDTALSRHLDDLVEIFDVDSRESISYDLSPAPKLFLLKCANSALSRGNIDGFIHVLSVYGFLRDASEYIDEVALEAGELGLLPLYSQLRDLKRRASRDNVPLPRNLLELLPILRNISKADERLRTHLRPAEKVGRTNLAGALRKDEAMLIALPGADGHSYLCLDSDSRQFVRSDKSSKSDVAVIHRAFQQLAAKGSARKGLWGSVGPQPKYRDLSEEEVDGPSEFWNWLGDRNRECVWRILPIVGRNIRRIALIPLGECHDMLQSCGAPAGTFVTHYPSLFHFLLERGRLPQRELDHWASQKQPRISIVRGDHADLQYSPLEEQASVALWRS
ncbi:hypothetical protein KBY31_21760, partial [Ruegeria pomeroyi]|nr:hypothetical protein [Ruegeria pomeroyi]